MSRSQSGYAHVHLPAVVTAVLMAAAGYGVGGKSFVSAFVAQPSPVFSRQSSATYTLGSSYPRRTSSRQTVMAATSSTKAQEQELQTPPKDFTFSPWGIWNQLTMPGNRPTKEASKEYESLAEKTGGVWKSRTLGLVTSNVFDSQFATTFLSKAEAAGKLVTSWPKSVKTLIGELSNAGDLNEVQLETMRQMYFDSIGPTAILSVKRVVEETMAKPMDDLRHFAETGEEFEVMAVLKDLTLNVITQTFAGRVEPEELAFIRDGFGVMAPAMMSIPRYLPWPLSRTPLADVTPFNFGRAMEVRAEIAKVVEKIVERRRKWFFADGASREPECVLDTILLRQAEQQARGGAKDDEVELNQQYILDNMVGALFGGQGTTAATLVRMVQMLYMPGSDSVREQVRHELDTTELRVASEGAGGLFADFPLIRSLSLESARVYPPIYGVFRKPTEDLVFNGYKIPKDSAVFWSMLPSLMSEKNYPEPERLCPFRFVNDKKPDPASLTGKRTAEEPGQPKPPMFGYGRRYCPGRELSKLEIIVFLKMFLNEFDGRLTENQDLGYAFLDGHPVGGLKMTISKRKALSPVA